MAGDLPIKFTELLQVNHLFGAQAETSDADDARSSPKLELMYARNHIAPTRSANPS